VLGTRFGIAAIATLLLLQVMRKPFLPAPGERVRVFLLGAVGYAFESSCFFAGLERGSAAAVALIFYCYPAIVTLVQRDLSRRALGTVVLSTAGTVLIVTAGAGVDITNTGVAFALLAAIWLFYAAAFSIEIGSAPLAARYRFEIVVGFRPYFDLLLNLLLGYAMVLLLMEDAKREFDDAQAELRIAHDQLRRTALLDSLTDALNRHAFAEGVGLDAIKATCGTVVLADLDNLKLVNDRFGHAAGDQLLRRCADGLRATLRPSDKLYRWGGDEFLLLVPSARASDVLLRLRATVDALEPVAVGEPGDTVRIAVSLGAADFAAWTELEAAIADADRAMYAEKARRKGLTPARGQELAGTAT